MIKFFRQIRQKLLSENRFRKYMVYALGEIILVVIGILIALAINNRNQLQIDEKNEQIYLIGLNEEFQSSKLKLKELIYVTQLNYAGARKILIHTNNNNASLDEAEFSELLYNTFSSDIAFNPNNSLLYEMINSGNLKNLSNPELRRLLTNWISTLDDISKQEIELGIQREKVHDMFRSNEYSMKTILNHVGVYEDLGISKSENEISNLALLNSTEFENNILLFILTCRATENAHYTPLMRDLDTILNLIDKEIDR